MAKQPEGRLSRRIIVTLKRDVGGWWKKIWQGPFSGAGTPDIIGCCEGLFFALETKRGRNQLEPIQEETIGEIINEGKGIAAEVRSVEDALRVVRQALAKAGRLPKRRGPSSNRPKNARGPVRSGNWKDVRRRRGDRETLVGEYIDEDGIVRRTTHRSAKQQDDNVAEVPERTSPTGKGIRRPRRLRDVLRSQGDIATRQPIRKGKRAKARRKTS